MYKFIRPILFALEAEKAHSLALKALEYIPNYSFPIEENSKVQALGLEFPHQIGLAAGFDKNGEHINALARLGFSFIEIGTVTPLPQSGNEKPRLFRLPQDEAIINRMGFNNHGVDVLVANVEKSNYQGILGINIGKNKDTPINHAVNDYLICLQKVYAHASYITINISSPNTPDLRKLQSGDYFKDLINDLREEQLHLADMHNHYVPLVIKLSPDETDEALKTMADVIISNGIDGIIATNTTCSRDGITNLDLSKESGGLSGKPLAKRSTECLQILKQVVGNDVTLIGVGGIDSSDVAREKLKAGASLLQIYTGLIYQGFSLVKKLVDGLAN